MELSFDFTTKLNDDIEVVIEHYKNKSAIELAKMFNVNMKAKNGFSSLTTKLIEYSGSEVFSQLNESDDFSFKTIRLDKYGQLKEAMSLPVFRYCDIVEETWETSELRKYFSHKIFAFTVFQADGKNQYLKKIIIWKMPSEVLDGSVRKVWQKMYDVLRNGFVVKYIDDKGRYFSYFPSSSENPHVHVRPHAQNRNDTYPLPVHDRLTGLIQYPKHSFWLNRAYVLKIISKEDKS